jgi:N-methylhydantoinase A/oxoprolinase/acetone carboxylase beta subunit
MTDCAIYRREDLTSGQRISGPAIVEELDSTTLIDPGLTLSVTAEGLGIMEV